MKKQAKAIDAAIRRGIDSLRVLKGHTTKEIPLTVTNDMPAEAILLAIKRHDLAVNYRESSPNPTLIYRVMNAVYLQCFRLLFLTFKQLKGSLRK